MFELSLLNIFVGENYMVRLMTFQLKNLVAYDTY